MIARPARFEPALAPLLVDAAAAPAVADEVAEELVCEVTVGTATLLLASRVVVGAALFAGSPAGGAGLANDESAGAASDAEGPEAVDRATVGSAESVPPVGAGGLAVRDRQPPRLPRPGP